MSRRPSAGQARHPQLAAVRPRREPLARGARQCRPRSTAARTGGAKRGGKARRFEPVPQPRSTTRDGGAGRRRCARELRRRWRCAARLIGRLAQRQPIGREPAHAADPPCSDRRATMRGRIVPARQRLAGGPGGVRHSAGASRRRRSGGERERRARPASPGGTLRAAASGTVSAAAPPVVRDDRQAARHRLGQHHAVALVERRHDEDVGALHRGCRAPRRRRRRRARCGRESGARRRLASASVLAGARGRVAPAMVEPPVEIRAGRASAATRIVALARRDRADGEQLHRLAACPGRAAPARCRARRRRSCSAGTSKSAASGRAVERARDDHVPAAASARLSERQQARPRRCRRRGRLSRPSGWCTSATIAAVQTPRSVAPAWRRRQGRRSAGSRPPAAREQGRAVSARSAARRRGKPPGSAQMAHVDAERRQERQDLRGHRRSRRSATSRSPGSAKATSRSARRPGPSNQARATSVFVQRDADRARPSVPGPSAPALAALAMASKTCGTGTRSWCAALELRQRVEVLVGQRLERLVRARRAPRRCRPPRSAWSASRGRRRRRPRRWRRACSAPARRTRSAGCGRS